MKNFTFYICAITALIMLSGCASIVSKSTYPLTVNTNPAGVNVVVKDGKGIEIFNGTSPATVNLKSGAGFFKKAEYTVHVSADGYSSQTVPVNFKIDGWYWGNILLGGVIGMLIVDPATGAMYKLEDEYINVPLKTKNTSRIDDAQLRVYDINSIPANWEGRLVKMQP